MREIIFLTPVFKEMIWGGNRLKTDFRYNIPSEHTGECWAISAHRNGESIVSDGTFKGQTLSKLFHEHRELFGNIEGKVFPLLIKIIDAKADLSIQVHPDDEYAKVHENGSLGKTECWYVLDCEEDSKIVIGHHGSTKEELEDYIHQGKWNELLRVIDVKKGNFFQIEAGTVHAIKAGTLIYEVQLNSDITYRLYDYDRLSDGKPRELHIEKSLDVITVPFLPEMEEPAVTVKENYKKIHYISCPFYSVDKLEVHGKETFIQDKAFQMLSVIEGKGSIDGIILEKGNHFILPYEYGDYTLEGNMEIIRSWVFSSKPYSTERGTP